MLKKNRKEKSLIILSPRESHCLPLFYTHTYTRTLFHKNGTLSFISLAVPQALYPAGRKDPGPPFHTLLKEGGAEASRQDFSLQAQALHTAGANKYCPKGFQGLTPLSTACSPVCLLH